MVEFVQRSLKNGSRAVPNTTYYYVTNWSIKAAGVQIPNSIFSPKDRGCICKYTNKVGCSSEVARSFLLKEGGQLHRKKPKRSETERPEQSARAWQWSFHGECCWCWSSPSPPPPPRLSPHSPSPLRPRLLRRLAMLKTLKV
jgi:hypothetical protein